MAAMRKRGINTHFRKTGWANKSLHLTEDEKFFYWKCCFTWDSIQGKDIFTKTQEKDVVSRHSLFRFMEFKKTYQMEQS